eukprot:scaffold1841_cov183-Isochrysis_galbana.AAC.1
MVQPVVNEMCATVHAAGSSLLGLFTSCSTFDSTVGDGGAVGGDGDAGHMARAVPAAAVPLGLGLDTRPPLPAGGELECVRGGVLEGTLSRLYFDPRLFH